MELGSNQKEWIAALRSGTYPQTKGVLHRTVADDHPVGYCCLGVACEVRKVEKRASKDREHYGRSYSSGAAPDEVVKALALRSGGRIDWTKVSDPKWVAQAIALNGTSLPRGLASINDRGGTFAFIADFIEANPEAVFTEPR